MLGVLLQRYGKLSLALTAQALQSKRSIAETDYNSLRFTPGTQESAGLLHKLKQLQGQSFHFRNCGVI